MPSRATNKINILILHYRAGQMLGSRNMGRESFGMVWVTTISALVVFSLLVAQNIRVEFPQPSSVSQYSITAGPAHRQPQRFYPDGVQWTAPVGGFVILSTSGGSASQSFTQQLLPATQTKGFRFNRPPPVN
jgi:hypothetical protein